MTNLLQVRIDSTVKAQAEAILNNLGLNMSSAVRLFLNRVVIEQGLPFRMRLEGQDERQSESLFDPIAYLEAD